MYSGKWNNGTNDRRRGDSVKKLPYIARFVQMSQTQVLDKFQGLPNSFSDGEGQQRFVYIPGTRNDRVLLVAHADTVWPEKPDLEYNYGVLYSSEANRKKTWLETKTQSYSCTKIGIGIGVDDRAGCGIIWQLRKLGHSILITSGEEQGCIGTKYIMHSEWWHKEINTTHSYAIEFDRRGRNDAVFYDIGTNKFAKYIQENTGFKAAKSHGNTDICLMCKLICGVNLSVGYYDQHSPNERLSVSQWQNTLATAKKLLSEPKIPLFELDSTDKFIVKEVHTSIGYNSNSCYNRGSTYTPDTYTVTCCWCNQTMKQEEWIKELKCKHCHKDLP